MPHVMTYPEIVEASKTGSIIYEEVRMSDRVRPLKFDGIDFVGVKDRVYLILSACDEENCPDYNLYYRCWDEEPTEELRNATPWNGDPYQFLREE